MTLLALDKIRIDGGTQSRVTCSDELIADYAERLSELPPAVVFFDGTAHWMADGFHRFHAHRKAGRAKMKCEIREGDIHDARLFSASANNAHGLRRSNADKRACVVLLLKDDKWSKSSNRWIAEQAGVSHEFVRLTRQQLSTVDSSTPKSAEPGGRQKGKDGKWREPPKAKPPQPAAEPAPHEWQCKDCDTWWPSTVDECAHCAEDEPPEDDDSDDAPAADWNEGVALNALERSIERAWGSWRSPAAEVFAVTLEAWAKRVREESNERAAAE